MPGHLCIESWVWKDSGPVQGRIIPGPMLDGNPDRDPLQTAIMPFRVSNNNVCLSSAPKYHRENEFETLFFGGCEGIFWLEVVVTE